MCGSCSFVYISCSGVLRWGCCVHGNCSDGGVVSMVCVSFFLFYPDSS